MLRSSMKWLLCCIPACTLVRPLDELSSERPEPPYSEPAPNADPTGEVYPEQSEHYEDLELADDGASLTPCTSDIQCPEGRCVEAGGGCQPCPPEMSLVRFADGAAFCTGCGSALTGAGTCSRWPPATIAAPTSAATA